MGFFMSHERKNGRVEKDKMMSAVRPASFVVLWPGEKLPGKKLFPNRFFTFARTLSSNTDKQMLRTNTHSSIRSFSRARKTNTREAFVLEIKIHKAFFMAPIWKSYFWMCVCSCLARLFCMSVCVFLHQLHSALK